MHAFLCSYYCVDFVAIVPALMGMQRRPGANRSWVGIIFLLVQGISELFKSYWAATKGKWPGEEE